MKLFQSRTNHKHVCEKVCASFVEITGNEMFELWLWADVSLYPCLLRAYRIESNHATHCSISTGMFTPTIVNLEVESRPLSSLPPSTYHKACYYPSTTSTSLCAISDNTTSMFYCLIVFVTARNISLVKVQFSKKL